MVSKSRSVLPDVRPLLALVLAALCLSTGCKEEEPVARYRAPKERIPQRLLGAIIPHGEKTWFFKLLGPRKAVDAAEKEFIGFIESVRFTDKDLRPVTWTLPAGWSEKPGSELRYATLLLGPKDKPLELTVVPLGGEAGSVLANVNRWRGQVGLGDVDEDGLGKLTRETKVDGKSVTLVDLRPEEEPAPAPPPPPEPNVEPTYTLPEGWRKSDRKVQFTTAVFEAGDSAMVTISPLAGTAGGAVPNVKRWRGQVGLEPVDDAEIKKGLLPVKVDGVTGESVDLSGPKARLLVVMVQRGGQTWFFKMLGPPDAVEKEKPSFEAFIKSVRFAAVEGAKP